MLLIWEVYKLQGSRMTYNIVICHLSIYKCRRYHQITTASLWSFWLLGTQAPLGCSIIPLHSNFPSLHRCRIRVHQTSDTTSMSSSRPKSEVKVMENVWSVPTPDCHIVREEKYVKSTARNYTVKINIAKNRSRFLGSKIPISDVLKYPSEYSTFGEINIILDRYKWGK